MRLKQLEDFVLCYKCLYNVLTMRIISLTLRISSSLYTKVPEYKGWLHCSLALGDSRRKERLPPGVVFPKCVSTMTYVETGWESTWSLLLRVETEVLSSIVGCSILQTIGIPPLKPLTIFR